jgi:hypothetical protein
MQDYQAEMKEWEQSKKGDKPEEPKPPTLYFFDATTGEGIPGQANAAPEKALLGLVDELSGLFNSANAYRNGRGSDKQDLLSYFDGLGKIILRVTGVKVNVEKIYLSIFGTIQPAILKSHMTNCSDPDGQWARFLFVNQPLAAATLCDDDGQSIQIHESIADFYRKIDQLPEMEYRLSRPAFKHYQPIYNQLERLRVSSYKSGMRAVYSKMEGYIGRLALNLHVLWELASGKACPDEEIPLFTMEMAIKLAKFFIGQVTLIHAHSDHEELAPHIVKLIERSKLLESVGKDGWVDTRSYQRLFNKQPKADVARSWMKEAEAMGFGRTRGTSTKLEYHWRNDSNNDYPPDSPPPSELERDLSVMSVDVSGLSVPPLTSESIDNKGTQDFVSDVSGKTSSLENVVLPQHTHNQKGVSPKPELEIDTPPLTSLTNSCDVDIASESLVSATTDKTTDKLEPLTKLKQDAPQPPIDPQVEAKPKPTLRVYDFTKPKSTTPAQPKEYPLRTIEYVGDDYRFPKKLRDSNGNEVSVTIKKGMIFNETRCSNKPNTSAYVTIAGTNYQEFELTLISSFRVM